MTARAGIVAIEVGASGVRALIKAPGRAAEPVLVDDELVASAGVFIAPDGSLVAGRAGATSGRDTPDRYVPDLVRRLGSRPVRTGCGVDVDPVAGLAAVLGLVTAAVEDHLPDSAVLLLVPGGWGPQRRLVVLQAARKAGLGDVRLVPTAVAVASGHTPSGAGEAGRWLVVVDVGVGCAVSVLRPDSGAGWVVEAELTGDVGGDRVDQLLAATVAAMAGAPIDTGVVAAVRAAKEGLAVAEAVLVPLPGTAAPVVVTVGMAEQVTGSVSTAIAGLVRDAVEAAQPPAGMQPVVMLAGGGAQVPGLSRVLASSLGCPVEVVTDPRWCGLQAAVTQAEPSPPVWTAQPEVSARPTDPSGGVPPPVVPSTTVRMAGVGAVDLVTVGVPGLMSLVCFAQAAFAGRVEQPGTLYAYLVFNRGEFGLAVVFAFLAAQGLVPWLDEVSARGGPVGVGAVPRRLAGAMLTAIALAGMAGFIYAALVGVLFHLSISGFLPWALLPAAFPGAVMAVCAVLVVLGRPPPVGGWLRWLRFRTEAVACAAVGMGLVQLATTAVRMPGTAPIVAALGRAGGLLVGVGVGLALVTGLRARLLVAVPMGVFCALIAGLNTTTWLAGLFITAVTGWWLHRLWQLTGLSAVIDRATTRRSNPPTDRPAAGQGGR